MGDFEHDTAVRARSGGCFDCEIGADWWVLAGPNGGYLAAILVRAIEAKAGAEARPLRSLTVHYLRTPDVGPACVKVAVERAGRSAASLVAFCDSWFPSIFAVTREPLAVPTLELTVHLRVSRPLPPDWVLGRFSTRTARDGFLGEDGEIYSREGRLLAQSRQLALSL